MPMQKLWSDFSYVMHSTFTVNSYRGKVESSLVGIRYPRTDCGNCYLPGCYIRVEKFANRSCKPVLAACWSQSTK